MSVFELIISFIIILGALAIGYGTGYYAYGIKMCDAHLKIIQEKWKPLIDKTHYENDYERGKLAGICQVFEWLHEEDI